MRRDTHEAHRVWMQRALQLARRGEGLTRPNPPVGALLVKNGRVVGEGYHRRAGGPHAEAVALGRAGASARGATLYVTLEPCSTWGRTPPCVDAILAAGVRHVVVATKDPNPRHAGRGLRVLRRKGIRVTTGVCDEEAQELIAPFARWVVSGFPHVTLKLGPSLDGRIADRTGASRWITGPRSRALVQALRRKVDVVMVGAGTVAADNPSLMPRPMKGRLPLRVIVDSARAVAPLGARVFTDEFAARTLLAVPREYPAAHRRRLVSQGVEILLLPSRRGHIRMSSLLRELGRRGVLHVLCEGGGVLAASLIEEQGVDEYLFLFAPRIIGGRASPCCVSGDGWLLEESPVLEIFAFDRVGEDIMIRAKPGSHSHVHRPRTKRL